METELPIEFFLSGVPASLSGSRRGIDAWKTRVETAARTALIDGHQLISKPLALEIVLLLDADMQGDIDNVVKPIQDAMNRVVYDDDHQIEQLTVVKFLSTRPLSISNPSSKLEEAMAQERPLVYIKVHEDFIYAT